MDIRDRAGVLDLVRNLRPSAIVHAAGQPSHDRAAAIPFDDFETNAVGTLNLLEAARQACPEAPFVHMSTNKVYGDTPNRLGLKELETRWDYLEPGIPRASRRRSPSTSLSTRCLAPPSLPRTSWCRSTGAILTCRPAAFVPAA
jgi:dTDP-D-glucose 4,6-dehydratase